MSELLDFRQRASAYVLRHRLGWTTPEVLVILHPEAPEAGVQVPGGGALAHETAGEAAIREAVEETGVAGPRFGEVLGSTLMRTALAAGGFQVTTYSWLHTVEERETWEHQVVSGDGDHGLRLRCEFRPVAEAAIDWGMDRFLPSAVRRFEAMRAPGVGAPASR